MEDIIPFGKYKGKTLKYIKENDKHYYWWLLKQDCQFLKDVETKRVNEALNKIEKLIKEGRKVRFVNVHCVGEEYRLGGIYDISLEEIVGNQYLLNSETISKDNYDKLHKILTEYWIKQGKIVEDRGLY